jgi:hypothetical protein
MWSHGCRFGDVNVLVLRGVVVDNKSIGAAYDGVEIRMVEASWMRWTGGVNGARKMLC